SPAHASCCRLRCGRRLDDRNDERRARADAAEVDVRVVLSEQPDRNVIALLSQHPDRLARANHVRRAAFDMELREERLLQLPMVILTLRLERVPRDLRK